MSNTQPLIAVPSGVGSPGGNPAPAPSYAPGARNRYDAGMNVYNAKASTLENTRAALAKTESASGSWDAVVIGDSFAAGYNGAAYNSAAGWPFQLATLISNAIGAQMADGVVPFTGENDLTALGGLMSRTGASFIFSNGGVGTATTSNRTTVTSVGVVYALGNPLSSSFTIDGDGGHAMPVTGAQALGIVTVPGLASAPHTIVVSAPGNAYTYVAAVFNTPGNGVVRVHNLALSGSAAAGGAAQVNWSNQALWNNLAPLRYSSLTLAGVAAPQTVFIQLGVNDELLGVPVAQLMAGYAAIIANFPNSDVIILTEWNALGASVATYLSYMQALYALADSTNCIIVDWYDRVGGLAGATSAGLIGADGSHPTSGASINFGRAFAELFLS